MLRARLELARLTALAPKTSAATNYATSAKIQRRLCGRRRIFFKQT